MSAAGPPQGARPPWGERCAATKAPAWGRNFKRTPLIAGGFLAGALIGALPPTQGLSARWNCMASSGHWVVALQACEYRANRPFGVPADPAGREQNLLKEEDR